jgi:predicted dithiol-disulfide oxidoreductase (DUF899 family)
MRITFPGESPEYRAARDRLLDQEIELRRTMERVAAARRELPPGGVVPEDYIFQGAGPNGAPADVRLSELFAPGKDALVIYNFMFPRDSRDKRPGAVAGPISQLPLTEQPCPSCTAQLDQLDGAAEHVSQQINFAIVAKAPLPRILAFADNRGWQRLRLLSAADNTFKRDFNSQNPRRAANADAERLPTRQRRDPSLLELGDVVRAERPGAGSAPHRHHRAPLQPARSHARGTLSHLAGTAELRVTRGADRRVGGSPGSERRAVGERPALVTDSAREPTPHGQWQARERCAHGTPVRYVIRSHLCSFWRVVLCASIRPCDTERSGSIA